MIERHCGTLLDAAGAKHRNAARRIRRTRASGPVVWRRRLGHYRARANATARIRRLASGVEPACSRHSYFIRTPGSGNLQRPWRVRPEVAPLRIGCYWCSCCPMWCSEGEAAVDAKAGSRSAKGFGAIPACASRTLRSDTAACATADTSGTRRSVDPGSAPRPSP